MIELLKEIALEAVDRGSLAATTIVTNVQDFIMIVAKGLNIV